MGRTLDLLPFAATHRLADEDFGARCLAGAEAFGAPYTLFMAELEEAALFDSVVEAQGRVFISTELRGGGTTTPDTVALAEQGVGNVLRFAGILPGDPLPVSSQALEIPSADYYRVSEHRGLLEFAVALGDWVQQGEVLARVHSLDRTGQPPVDYRAPFAGMLIGRRHPARVDIGDTFAVLAVKR